MLPVGDSDVRANWFLASPSRPVTFKASEATAHLCGHTVANPDNVSSAVRKLIREWGEFCGTVPQLYDKNYDLRNQRRTVGSVRG